MLMRLCAKKWQGFRSQNCRDEKFTRRSPSSTLTEGQVTLFYGVTYTMTNFLRRSGRSKDRKSRALDPILATRSTSWASTISAKRTQSWRSTGSNSTGGTSTDLSLAYSSDSEVRDMLDELRVQKGSRVANDAASSVRIVHPPHESPGLPRVPSKSPKARKPTIIHIPNDDVFDVSLRTRLTFQKVEKSAREFETFVTSRVDQALSPLDDKIEMLLVNVDKLAALQTPLEVQSLSIDATEDLPTTPIIEKRLSFDNEASTPYKQLYSELIGSLFNDEPIPVIPSSAYVSDDESSVATEDSSLNSQNDEEKPSAKVALPTYTQVMEALLGDETMPDPLEPGIPSSIEISRVPSRVTTNRTN